MEFLEKTPLDKSQEMADLIGQEARRVSGGDLDDDGIVMVIRKNFWST